MMVLIVIEVVDGAGPRSRSSGASFLTTSAWNPVTDEFGARDLIWVRSSPRSCR